MNITRHSIRFDITLLTLITLVFFTTSCAEKAKESKDDIAVNGNLEEVEEKSPKRKVSGEFKKYWYAGEAEITSYKLEQARYGEMREGNAVLIFVTEPFHKARQVKADGSNPDNIPVLKLNSTKNYLTGIYPYSIMTSCFYPVHDNQHAVKVSFSTQEWCGQVYAQLNNREKFEITSHSYFESDADQIQKSEKNTLENELWNKLRVNPQELPIGDLKIIPSLEYMRLMHKELKAYEAIASLSESDSIKTYQITYPELERTLKINFTAAFPHTIVGWSDSYASKGKIMVSRGTKIKTIKTPYWQQNGNKNLPLRDSLGL
jgi:hypothetical protein